MAAVTEVSSDALQSMFDDNNRYQIEKSIGAGGMAEVYRAHDTTLDCTVAIKVMKPQLASDEYFIRQFKNEARAAAGLVSPYVVGIRDWVQDEKGCYIVMEYVHGVDLKRILKRHGAIDPEKIAEIASQVCLALQEAHARSIVHRDIKTSNIMLQKSGDIKVMDFGIAQSKRHSTPEDDHLIVGTVYYMSPEQIRGLQATASSDIYSLGIVMYELATNRMPFVGKSSKETARMQLEENPVAPMELNSAIDEDLNGIILKAMAKDPSERYQTTVDMRVDLERYLASSGHSPNRLIFPRFWAAAITQASEDDLVGKLFKIDGSQIIGRAENADIRIPDSTVSGKHMRVTPFGLYLEVEDLGSSNGTVVNGTPIQCKTLCQAGDDIDLGSVRIRIGKKN